MPTPVTALIFSKDRAFQLEGTLRSFALHCLDSDLVKITVLYKCSGELHAAQYRKLRATFPNISFIEEGNFKEQVLSCLDKEYLLLLVDDNIFTRDFRIQSCIQALVDNPAALAFSLRLGRNTTYCYAMDCAQPPPAFEPYSRDSQPPILRYNWEETASDFAYTLEVSSSIYRSGEIGVLLQALSYSHPNSLEAAIAQHLRVIGPQRPQMLCYETSVTFCNPINKVQAIAPANRAGLTVSHSSEDLGQVFEKGGHLDVASYSGFISNACHQEVPLKIVYENSSSIVTLDLETDIRQINAPLAEVRERAPLISVVIPAFKQAQFLPQAIGSMIAQTYPNWECVVVNDGSPDNTSAVTNEIIARYPNKKIKLVEKENEGLAEARNTGIRETSGSWILPLDSDDMFEPVMLEKLISAAHTDTRINIVSSYVRYFGARNEIIPIRQFSQAEIMRDNIFPYASLYRRDLWEKFGGYMPIVPFGAEDYNFWITCSGELFPCTVHEPLFLYRKHEGASMVDAVVSHHAEVSACLHTCHPDLYSANSLLEDHDVLSKMQDDTRALIDKHITKFPKYSQLYLWRGLHNEAQNHWRQAIRDFELSAMLAGPGDWQPLFRLTLLNAERKDYKNAIVAAKKTLESCPHFPARSQLESLIGAA